MKLKKMMLLAAAVILSAPASVIAQVNGAGQEDGLDYNTITTAVPFMRISPDARSGAMGDVGLALSPDANSQYWNVAKIAMSKKDAGFSISYTPWLKDLVNDINLSYLAGYFKFGEEDNKNQAISLGMRYFSLGSISYTDINAQSIGTGQPREFALDAGYSRKLSEKVSIGLSGKYISSNIINGAATAGSNYSPGSSFAVDFGAFYTTPIGQNLGEGLGQRLNLGFAVTNLGQKVSYSTDRSDFLPTNLGIGAAYEYNIDEYNKLTFALDLNKLLVPSPQYVRDSAGAIIGRSYPTDKTVIDGVFSSFGDAPEGGSEELKEVMVSFGAEYGYQDQFFARAGYFRESELKGDRQYFTLGLGVKYNIFGLNFAYLVPSGNGQNRNPLSNTLRFSLMFDFDDFSSIVKGKPKKEDKNTRDSRDD